MNPTVPPQYLTLPVLTERIEAPPVEPVPEQAVEDSSAAGAESADDGTASIGKLLAPAEAGGEVRAIDAGVLQALIRAELEALLPEFAERVAQGVFRGFQGAQAHNSALPLPRNDE